MPAADGGPALLARWALSGELDSPLPPGRIREVADRPAEPLDLLLERFLTPGTLLLLADSRDARLLTSTRRALSALPPPARDAGPFTAEAAGVPWEGEIDSLVQRAIEGQNGVSPAPPGSPVPRLFHKPFHKPFHGPFHGLLLRPDLARSCDGVELRDALLRWKQRTSDRCLIVVLGETSFALRHAPAGCPVLRCIPSASDPEPRLSTLWDDRWRRIFDGASASGDLLRNLWALLTDPELHEADGIARALSDQGCRDSLPHRSRLLEIWRGWVLHAVQESKVAESAISNRSAESAASGRGFPSIWMAARATSQLYALLHRLDRLAGDSSRRNLVGLPIDRWFCCLAAAGYSYLATALAALEGEILPAAHWVNVPPLEFANLRRADLSEGDLYHANLVQADLRQSVLRSTDLSRAHLKGADLRQADLRRSDLSYACLEQADLRGARLDGANLHRANLDDALLD